MNLNIDIGNTRAKLLAIQDGRVIEETFCDNQSLTGLPAFVSRHTFDKGAVSSVVRLSSEAQQALAQLPFSLLSVTPSTPLPISTAFPPSMGADRIAAIVAGMTLQPGKPLLIVDAGTCVTYEVIDDQGHYLGGNIAPGLQMRLRAMHEHTSLLPLVDVQGYVPQQGYDTDTAMRSGAVLGLQYEIEGYARHLRHQYPTLQVFMTGGNEMQMDTELRPITHYEKYLVPKGINKILEYNS